MPKERIEIELTKKDRLIATLAEDYLFTCKLLHNEAHKRRKALTNGKIKTVSGQKFMRFYEMFLASLYVVCEGFIAIKLKDEKIERLIHEHIDSLRLFRNGTFHYQKTIHKKLQFYSLDRMNWAEELYEALEAYVQTWIIQRQIDSGAVDPTDSSGQILTARQIQDLLKSSEAERA